MKRNKALLSSLLTLTLLFSTVNIPVIAKEPAVAQAATKVKINKANATICKQQSVQLKINGTTKKVTWKSSKPAIAKVTSKGKVTGVKPGTASISAKVSGKTYTCKVKVREHSYNEATCTKAATCKYCKSTKGEALGHEYKDTIVDIVEATKERKGYPLYKCDRCGDLNKGQYIDYNPTEEQVYEDLINLKESMPCKGNGVYKWKGNGRSGKECAGFVYYVSDIAFGYLPARIQENLYDVRVGDIIRIGNIHSVIILEVQNDGVLVADGDYGTNILWKSEFFCTYEDIEWAGYSILTRYPKTK